MSLINSILKDLDQRRQKNESEKRSFLTDVLLSAGKSRQFKVPGFIKFGIVISLVAVLGVLGWGQYKNILKSKYDFYVSSYLHSESPSINSPPIESKSQSVSVQNPAPVDQPTISAPSIDHQVVENTKDTNEKVMLAENEALVGASEVIVEPMISKELPQERKVQIVPAIQPKSEKKNAGTVAKKDHPVSKTRRAALGIEEAMRLIRKDNYRDAEKQLRRALWLQSDNLKAREILAMLLINQGRISEAAKFLVESLDIAPYHSPFAKLYARILVNQGETSRAIAILEQAQPDILVNPEYHSFLAALYQKLSMHERAIGKYQQVLNLRPNVGAWWLGLGISLEGLGRMDEALAAYQNARKNGNLSDNIITYINSRIKVLSNS